MIGGGVTANAPRSTTRLPPLPAPGVQPIFTEPLGFGEEMVTLDGPAGKAAWLTFVPVSSKSLKYTCAEAALNVACAIPTLSHTPAISGRVNTPPAGRLFVICDHESDRFVFQKKVKLVWLDLTILKKRLELVSELSSGNVNS